MKYRITAYSAEKPSTIVKQDAVVKTTDLNGKLIEQKETKRQLRVKIEDPKEAAKQIKDWLSDGHLVDVRDSEGYTLSAVETTPLIEALIA